MRNNEKGNVRGKDQMRGSYRSKYKNNERKRGESQKTLVARNTGEILRCTICESIFLFVRECPD